MRFLPAFILSSTLFGLLHKTPLSAGLTGVWLGMIYSPRWTGHLFWGVLLHSVFNLTSAMAP